MGLIDYVARQVAQEIDPDKIPDEGKVLRFYRSSVAHGRRRLNAFRYWDERTRDMGTDAQLEDSLNRSKLVLRLLEAFYKERKQLERLQDTE